MMAMSTKQIAKTAQYRQDRLDGVSAEDAIERARSASAFRAAAIKTCEEASKALDRRA